MIKFIFKRLLAVIPVFFGITVLAFSLTIIMPGDPAEIVLTAGGAYQPTEEQIEIKKGKTKKNLRKVFPGYVLIKMIVTEETWYIVRNTTGVTGFVGAGTKPIPLTTEEIRKMGIDDSVIEVDYEVGDTVEVLSQPLEGYTGQVEEINKDKGKVRVLITMFGRETSVELDFANVQKASK